ncbi:GlsB/YeaQ/YmgE family stress response membrane protein [Kitasatospora mediocidica]|uniref:GlsB/YeaQ/YmgE family stress response membrane protein n=1 Tax=Kitasatospora mediocidica TaxID=58352 RepID=UPI00055CFBEF|nr:GlsB/YeaQ/YmgE family stress response membrane protein [Kitasatospora mediocidica]
MGIVSWIILGLIAGAVAKLLLPGRDPGGIIVTTLIGIAGSFVGGWLSAHFLHRPVSTHFFDLASWVSAIAGALVLLVAYRLVFGNSRR